MAVVLKGAIKTHSYVRFDHLRYARRDGGVVLVAVAAARRRTLFGKPTKGSESLVNL